ncbi:hypothetical protein [Streptomyces sp. NPDC001980]|uniref:hypothetical protein n=1 Tax=Streptomyces sp. NPDC001980 TaxID=3157126 RepID=UPI003327F8EC
MTAGIDLSPYLVRKASARPSPTRSPGSWSPHRTVGTTPTAYRRAFREPRAAA